MGSIWRKGKDTLHNGTVLGVLLGIAVVWGSTILAKIEEIIPETWIVLGEYSIPVYIIGACALLGYLIDRY